MDQLIVFREGIESLDDNEFQQCLASIDKEFIISIMFKGFYCELNENKTNKMNKMNNIIAEIRRLRKDKSIINKKEADEDIDILLNNNDESIKLDNLPFVTLAEISSFLELTDQSKYERINRAIFIGSRSSKIPIHPINAKYFKKLVTFSGQHADSYLPKSRLSKSLSMNIHDFIDFDSEERDIILNHPFNHFELFENIKELQGDLSFPFSSLSSTL